MKLCFAERLWTVLRLPNLREYIRIDGPRFLSLYYDITSLL